MDNHPIKAIIFDLGGVFFLTSHHRGQHKWEQMLGLPPGKLESLVFESELCIQASRGLISETEYWNKLAKSLGIPDRVDELRQDFFEGDIVNEKLLAFILRLRAHYKIGVITNAWSDAYQNVILKTGIDKWADVVIISAEVRVTKPSPEIFWLCLDRLGVHRYQSIFIDDRPVNIEAARKLGINGVLFCDTPQVIRDINILLEGENVSRQIF